MVILEYSFVFWQTLRWVGFYHCYSHFQKWPGFIGYCSIFFPLDQEEGAKMFDSKSTLFITSRFDRKQYTHVQSLLTFLFSGAVSYSSSRTTSNILPFTSFCTSKLDFGTIRMVRKSINREVACFARAWQQLPGQPCLRTNFVLQLFSTFHQINGHVY